MKTLKKIAIVLPLMILLAAPAMAGVGIEVSYAQEVTPPTDTSPISDVGELSNTIDRIVGFLQTLLFALAAVFIIVAGYQYLTAAGDEESVGKAKNNLIYALIAVVLGIVATGVASLVENVLVG